MDRCGQTAADVPQARQAPSRQVWRAVDHSKFHRPAMVAVGRLNQVDTLFTDAPPPPPAFNALLAEAGVACVVADAAGHADSPTDS